MELLKLLANRVNNRQPVTPYDRVALPASASLDMIEINSTAFCLVTVYITVAVDAYYTVVYWSTSKCTNGAAVSPWWHEEHELQGALSENPLAGSEPVNYGHSQQIRQP
jgi:hypothetical protein